MIPRTQARQNLIEAVRKVQTALVDAGHYEHWQIKARDKREPGREEKEKAEARLERHLYQMFQYQQAQVENWLNYLYWDRKSVKEMPVLPELAFDDGDIAKLIRFLQDAVANGILLFGTGKPDIDYTLTNKEAAREAQKYTYELIKDLNNTTRDVLRSTLRQFVETPGMTIGDVVRQLPYDRKRAQRIAVTEITRAYAEGEIMAGKELAKQFPDVRVIKIWFTNADDLVCPICAPLDGQEAGINEKFSNGQDKPPAHPNCRCWIETTTALAELGGVEETITGEWLPSMTPSQADYWAKDSAYPGYAYHGTRSNVADIITNDGFVIPKDPQFGRFYGDGVYLSQDKGMADTFTDRLSNGKTIKTKVNIKNPYRIDEADFHEKIVGPIVDDLSGRGLPAETVQKLIPKEITERLTKMGYDSIITQEFNYTSMKSSQILVIFDPRNITVIP